MSLQVVSSIFFFARGKKINIKLLVAMFREVNEALYFKWSLEMSESFLYLHRHSVRDHSSFVFPKLVLSDLLEVMFHVDILDLNYY